jgi:competence protein ComEC
LPNLGWTIIFKRDPAGTNPPTVKPSTFPVDEINPIESPLCASVILPEPGGLKQYWVTVLDVGQGLSVMVRTEHNALLYDAGAKWGDSFDVGRQVVVPYLQAQGIDKIDKLIISHKDIDHAGGADAVLSVFDVKEVMSSSRVLPRMSNNHQIQACEAGNAWEWDGVVFEFLHPDRKYNKTNNQSCVLRVLSPYGITLLPGDIESKVEEKLVNLQPLKLPANLLIMPHHGSTTSSSQTFIREVSPQLAIASAGYLNRFRHPAGSVVERYNDNAIAVLETAKTGSLEIRFEDSEENSLTNVRMYRKDNPHYWNHRP